MSSIYENTNVDRKASKIRRDNTKHYPNKDEAKVLRRLKAETGLSEEEIRSVKKYRRMLSKAQKEGQKGQNKINKYYRNIIKEACQITGLAKEHPETIKEIENILQNERFRPFTFHRPEQMSGKKLVKKYG